MDGGDIALSVLRVAVVIVLAIGLVPAVILSWVFEWTPEGLRRDSDVTTPAPAVRTSGHAGEAERSPVCFSDGLIGSGHYFT